MNTELAKEIIGIKTINLLFFNYTEDMLEEMKTIREFNHCWENYVNLKEQTYMLNGGIKLKRNFLKININYHLS